MRRAAAIALALALAAGCGGRGEDPGSRSGDPHRVPFKLTRDRGDFLFEWVDEMGELRTGARVDDVPEPFRAKVRIEPLSIPPDRRAPPDRVYLADLRRPGPGGVYPVQVVPREELEALAGVLSSPLPRPGAPLRSPPASGAEHPPSPPGAPVVTIYGASWCGACRQAAAWLRSKGIPFVEEDIERDPRAREEMMAKCRAAGISPNSIPILDVRGRILQGFSPRALSRLLDR